MKLSLLAFFLSASAPVLAAVGGRCSGSHNDGYCICLDENQCRRYGGEVSAGGPGNWACPYDPNNVKGCRVFDCPGRGEETVCSFRSKCLGTVLRDPICPGGNDFVCCSY